MPRIHTTKTMATTAGVAFPLCFIDPTGASQLVFLTAGTGAGIGLTINTGKFVFKKVKKLATSSKETKSYDLLAETPNSIDELVMFNQRAFEECIRKLASCMTGVAISGTLSIVMPQYLVGLLVNGVEVAYQLRKLRKLRDLCGGTKELMENVSKFDIALQISAGVCIRSLTTILFLGAGEFNTFVDTISHAGSALMALGENGASPAAGDSATGAAEIIKDAHDNLVDHGLLSATTAVAGAPTEVLTQFLGNGTEYIPTWNDGTPTSHLAGIGGAQAITETGLARIVEEPIHKGINIASAAGEKIGASMSRPVGTSRMHQS
jgi:hypothetical protein